MEGLTQLNTKCSSVGKLFRSKYSKVQEKHLGISHIYFVFLYNTFNFYVVITLCVVTTHFDTISCTDILINAFFHFLVNVLVTLCVVHMSTDIKLNKDGYLGFAT